MQNYAAHPAATASEASFAAMHATQAMHASGHPAYHHAGANEHMMAVNGVHSGPGAAGAGMFAPDMTTTQDGYVAPLNVHPAMDISGLHHPSHDHHVFMPLPQAPRLPVAAARASAMSAMYYDPSLHSQHAFNGNFGPSAPWISNWHGNGLGPVADHATAFNGGPATVHHRQLEQQLKMQNHLTQAHHQQQQLAQQPMASVNNGAANEPHTFGNVYAAPPLLANNQHPSNFIDSSAPRQHAIQARMPASGAPSAFHAPSNVAAPQKHSAAQWTGNTHWSGAADRASHQAHAAHVGARHPYGSGATAQGMDTMNVNSNGHRVFAAPSATSNAYPASAASAAAAVGQQYYMATQDARQAMMHGVDAAGTLDVSANTAAGQWQPHRNADKTQYQGRGDSQFASKSNVHQYPFHRPDHQHQAQQHHGQRSQSFQMPSSVADVDYRYPGAQEAAAWAWMNGQQRSINDGNAWAMQNRAQERNHLSQYHRGSLDSKLHQPSQWQGEHGGPVLPNIAVPAPMQKDQFAAVQQPVYYPDVVAHQIAGAHAAKASTAAGPVHDHQSGAGTVMADANAQKNPSAPAPPSPDTLDKSAVPVSSVGAEIVWAAAAALLDPSLWLTIGEDAHRTTHQTRKRMASQGSSSDVSPLATPFTSPVQTSHDGAWQQKSLAMFDGSNISAAHARPARGGLSSRLASDAQDESSCSSSEPGTPPTALPSLRTWDEGRETGAKGHSKRVSMSALHGMRSLGLSSNDDSSRANGDWHSERRSASPMDTHSPRARVRSFRRSESYDRSRETVANVAGLLEWTWKWSINDDKLDSLRHWQSRNDSARSDGERSAMLAVSPMTRQGSGQGRVLGREENAPTTGLTMSGTDPSPAFRRFTHQVLAQTLVSPTAFILGIMYALRVLHLAVAVDPVTGHAQVDPEAVEIFAQPYSAAPFKLFTLGLMIANKHLDDNTFLNKTWNEVTGISLAELNRAERWYLEKCSFEITVPEATWVAFLERLHARTERRISTFNSVKRIRVPITKEAPDAPRRPDSYVVPHAGSEESQKRFLFCIEEALQALGHAPDFTLNDDARDGKHVQRNGDAGLVRPKSALTHLHHQSHSAPTVGVAHAGSSLHSDERNQDDDDDDVFDDEDGPYRPYDGSSRRGSQAHKAGGKGHVARNSIATDSVLNRSVSDSLTTTVSSCAYQEHRSHAKSDLDVNRTSAPLAPSVLLELLNKGQHLAHAAH